MQPGIFLWVAKSPAYAGLWIQHITVHFSRYIISKELAILPSTLTA
jgi:hypothetical protein